MKEMRRPDRPADWGDCHQGRVCGDIPTARAAFEQGFARQPKWVGLALKLRNRLVAWFGLTTESPDGKAMMLHLPVVRESPECYEVGLIDRHLTFTITSELAEGQIRLTTSIWFNHWAGRIYLLVVLIPHKIIVKQMLRGLQ